MLFTTLQQYLDTVYKLEQRLIGCEQSQAGKSVGLEDARKELEQLQVQHKKEIARQVLISVVQTTI